VIVTPVSLLSGQSATEQDLRLMALVAARDPEAQRRVATRLAPRVRRLCRLLLRHAADADDAAQLSLIEVLRSACGFRFDNGIERWADRITVRTAARYARAQRRASALVDQGVDPEALSGPMGGWPSLGRMSGDIDACLDRLGDERREAFVLKHALGYSVTEIAELTGAPVGTVKDRLVAARKILREMIVRQSRHARPGPGWRRAPGMGQGEP
jgi:RNA polymerase sigma-70 factor (ECF subfamily)